MKYCLSQQCCLVWRSPLVFWSRYCWYLDPTRVYTYCFLCPWLEPWKSRRKYYSGLFKRPIKYQESKYPIYASAGEIRVTLRPFIPEIWPFSHRLSRVSYLQVQKAAWQWGGGHVVKDTKSLAIGLFDSRSIWMSGGIAGSRKIASLSTHGLALLGPMVLLSPRVRQRNFKKYLRLSKHTDITIHWNALEEHLLMVPLVFQFDHLRGICIFWICLKKLQSYNGWYSLQCFRRQFTIWQTDFLKWHGSCEELPPRRRHGDLPDLFVCEHVTGEVHVSQALCTTSN
jgi:hypothetical protein